MKRSHLWILTALLFISCGGDDGAGPGDDGGGNNNPPDAVPTAEGTPTGAPTTETIGAAGGAVASSDGAFTLNIPAGALASDTDITIQPTTNTAWGGIGAGYQLTPDGLTFGQPVELVLQIAPADLAGSAPDALEVAVQDDAGYWFVLKNRTYDDVSGTLTCTTTHFSNYAGVEGVQIRPPVADVGVDGTVDLTVQICSYEQISNDPNISAALLTCSDNSIYPVSNWSVNGVAGGNSTVGRVATTSSSNHARYTAPAAEPIANPVAVSAKVISGRSGSQLILVANITITSGTFTGTITHNGADGGYDTPDKTVWNITWTSDGALGDVESFTGAGTVTYTMVDQTDCPSESMTPNSSTINSDNTWMIINRGVDPPTVTILCDADWDVHECYQCLTDPEYCVDYHFFVGFSDNLGTISADGNTVTGYFLDLNNGENWTYQFTR